MREAILDKAASLRDGAISVEEFQDWYAEFAFARRGQGTAGDILAKVDMCFVQFGLGEFDESELGARVKEALHDLPHL